MRYIQVIRTFGGQERWFINVEDVKAFTIVNAFTKPGAEGEHAKMVWQVKVWTSQHGEFLSPVGFPDQATAYREAVRILGADIVVWGDAQET